MKKLLIAIIAIASVVFVYTNFNPSYNLRKYSVYYAHNMPHKEGTHPEMAMALENIKAIYTPDKKGIKYDYDGLAKVYNENNRVNGNIPAISATYDDNGVQYMYFRTDNKYYIWGDDFFLKGIYDPNTANMASEKIEGGQEASYKEVYKNFGFLVEANVNRKPLINMQKRFNEKYYKRFN